ncbi:pilus assembly protein TadG-related protein [Amycolatopsis circi]|uniref:pilus assembly protein TadG-related protein n=1 Tax=Amycolatopsis circi TaxID=871959 RepID=UPI000E2482F1|nr:pilus assembly protein TadG-related protein [Amycolatopsis circi]
MNLFRDERGSISVLILGLSLALIIAVGLAVDGSRKALAASRATAVAEEAARAGGQALDPHALADGRTAHVDPGQAAVEAKRYLAAAGISGTVQVQDNRIAVDTTETLRTVFLGVIGIPALTVHGHGAADLISAG